MDEQSLSDLYFSECPICLAERDAEALFYKYYYVVTYNSAGFHRRLRKGGFCPHHAARLHDPVRSWAIVATYEELIGTYRRQIDQVQERLEMERRWTSSSWRRFADNLLLAAARMIGLGRAREISMNNRIHRRKRWMDRLTRPKASCPVCESRQYRTHHELINLGQAVPRLESPDLVPLLCRHHLWLAVREVPLDAALALIERARVAMGYLDDDLHEFSRKHNYLYRDESFGKESRSWAYAMQLLDSTASVEAGETAHRTF